MNFLKNKKLLIVLFTCTFAQIDACLSIDSDVIESIFNRGLSCTVNESINRFVIPDATLQQKGLAKLALGTVSYIVARNLDQTKSSTVAVRNVAYSALINGVKDILIFFPNPEMSLKEAGSVFAINHIAVPLTIHALEKHAGYSKQKAQMSLAATQIVGSTVALEVKGLGDSPKSIEVVSKAVRMNGLINASKVAWSCVN